MKNFLNTKTVIGSLIIAILGSALWENVFKDILSFGSKTLLTISTLGIEKYKNDIYINIARGFFEQVSIQMLSLGLGVLLGVICAIVMIIFRNKNQDELKKASKIKEWFRNHKRLEKVVLLTYTFFVIGVTILSLSKIAYVNRSIAYYKQLESITAPYLTLDQEKNFNSLFAQIKNKKDYIKLINELTGIVNEKVQNLPTPPLFIF